jgi:hypothetical protein
MTASEIVQKMMNDFEKKSGKKPTDITLAPTLYDSLKAELKRQIPEGIEIDYIKIRGVLIQRQVLQ